MPEHIADCSAATSPFADPFGLANFATLYSAGDIPYICSFVDSVSFTNFPTNITAVTRTIDTTAWGPNIMAYWMP
jgi:hypothetical protein